MKGIYILLISVTKDISVNIGVLGSRNFQKGLYTYVGSAQNNLEKRVERHLRRAKREFWHIDYLLSNRQVEVLQVLWKKAERLEECRIAERLSQMAVPITSFGSSDCRCTAHLFRIEAYDYLSEFTREIGVTSLDKMVLMAKTGWCTWITGLPGSGKSTVADALLELLKKERVHAQLLSSDALRRFLTPKPSYSLEERDAVYATLVYIAKLLTQNGVNVVIDATGNLRRYREDARNRITQFIEVYLECPLEVCKRREARRIRTHRAPRQIYELADKGKAPTVPGVGQPYEAPSNPEATLDTAKCTPVKCAQKVLEKILLAEADMKSGASQAFQM
jgi:adenylylsulfate kinase